MDIYNPTNNSLLNTQICLRDPHIDTSEGGCAKGNGQVRRGKVQRQGCGHSPTLAAALAYVITVNGWGAILTRQTGGTEAAIRSGSGTAEDKSLDRSF